jgi:magnesium chelatase family protein
VNGLSIYPVASLRDVVEALRGERPFSPLPEIAEPPPGEVLDLLDVRGNEIQKRALEVAAAGAHNLLFIGPPGTGKSMLARRLPGILPPLTEPEALEATSIYSAAGLLRGGGLLRQRPFRSPHHDVSVAGLCGGGSHPRPGEVSLAHNGVLFLDELPEFPRMALESLRQPLEERRITIVRSRMSVTYPAAFALCAAMNPCPCGYRGSSVRACTCDIGRLMQYQARLSGPLLDRFDLHVTVPHIDCATLLAGERSGEPSSVVRERVIGARMRQLSRQPYPNACLGPEGLLAVARPDERGERLLLAYASRHGLSNRAVHRVLRVARTLADLAGEGGVKAAHLAEALTLRALDRQDC